MTIDRTVLKSEPPKREAERPRFRRLVDVAVFVFFFLLAYNTRRYSFVAAPLNPDESLYEALAAFSISSGTSAFALPTPIDHLIKAYTLFGYYQLPRVRVGVLFIAWAITVLTYLMLKRAVGRPLALLGGVLFLLWNVLYEGHAANREWFSLLPIVFGVYLFVRSGEEKHPRIWLFASGFFNCVGLWMKDQAAPIVLSIPLLLLTEAVIARAFRTRFIDALTYALGGIVGFVGYVIPYALQGRLGEHFGLLHNFTVVYGMTETEAFSPYGTAFQTYRFGFYEAFGPHWIVVAVYAVTLLACARMVLAAIGVPIKATALDLRVSRLVTIQLLTSAFAVQMSRRFFEHYYLFLLPFASFLYALAAHNVLSAFRTLAETGSTSFAPWTARLRKALVVLTPALLLAAAAGLLELTFPETILLTALVVAAMIVIGLAGRLIFRTGAGCFRRSSIGLICAFFVVPVVNLLWVTLAFTPKHQPTAPPGSIPVVGTLFAKLADWHWSNPFGGWASQTDEALPGLAIREIASPNDYLFVWGWKPEVYSAACLPPSSHYITCNAIAGDTSRPTDPPAIDHKRLAELLRDLEKRPPRFFVDASEASYSMAAFRTMEGYRKTTPLNPYKIAYFPELIKHIMNNYEPYDTIRNSYIFVRKGTRPPKRKTRE